MFKKRNVKCVGLLKKNKQQLKGVLKNLEAFLWPQIIMKLNIMAIILLKQVLTVGVFTGIKNYKTIVFLG